MQLTKSGLFSRYVDEKIIDQLMSDCAPVLLANDASIEFCIAYFKSIPTESPQLLRFSRIILEDPDIVHQAPRVADLYALVFKRNGPSFTISACQKLLPTAIWALMQAHTTHMTFLREFLRSADDLCLFTLVELVCRHIMYHIELQE